MTEIKEQNAVIEGVTLGTMNRGVLSAYLNLDYDSSGQSFGGFSLSGPYCAKFIERCLEIGGVSEWNDLVGKTIRVKCTWTEIHAIGHIIKDDWFDIKKEFKKLEKKEKEND